MTSLPTPGQGGPAVFVGHGSDLIALPIAGAPISVEQRQKHYQRTDDGTLALTFSVIGVVHRDSNGRLFRSSDTIDASGTVTGSVGIILDPVGGGQIALVPAMKIAVRMVLPPSHGSTFGFAVNLDPAHDWKIATEDLGKRVIEGVEFVGSRITHTAMDQDGLIDTAERWFCEELKLVGAISVIRPHDSYTVTIHNLRRQQPDPKLFEVPSGYTVTGPQ